MIPDDVTGRRGWAAFVSPQSRKVFDMIKLMSLFMGRSLYSRLNPKVPRWVAPEALALDEGDLKELLEDVKDGRLRPILDAASPFDFTEADIRKAVHLQKSCHAHGKVVIKIADK